MKVLYFHQHFSTPKGAAGIRSYEMARRLIGRGHQVTMVCGSYGGGVTGLSAPFAKGVRRGNVEGIDIVEFDLAYSNADGFVKRAMIFVKFALRSVKLALTERYDVVFATTTPLTAGIPGIFARWLRGKPFVFEVRDLWPELPKAMGVIRNPLVLGAMSALEWASYRSAHRLVGLSPGIVEGIARRGVACERITLVPNGCDLDIFGVTWTAARARSRPGGPRRSSRRTCWRPSPAHTAWPTGWLRCWMRRRCSSVGGATTSRFSSSAMASSSLRCRRVPSAKACGTWCSMTR